MEIYTFQLANWRKVKELGILYMDTTIKSGDWMLAPTWTLLSAYKYNDLSEEDYATSYNILLEERLIKYPEYFDELFNLEALAVGCYCRAGKFCHRHLLVNFFEKRTECIYRGEIK